MSVKLIVTGLANSGKSSFINCLVSNSFEIKVNKLSMSFDFGALNDEVTLLGINGENFFRNIASQIAQGADGVIILIDSTDYKNFETNIKLAQVIHSMRIPFLIFANKIDMPTAYPLASLENMFNSYCELHSGSAINGEGVKEILYEALTMINDYESFNNASISETALLARDGGKSEMIDVLEYFYGYLQELQNYVISCSYASYDRKVKVDDKEESQVLFA